MDITKLKYRAVIEFLTNEGLSPQKIHERLVSAYKDQSPSYATVKRWVAKFKRGRDSLEDDPRSGRPVEVMTKEVCRAVEDLVMEDRRIKKHGFITMTRKPNSSRCNGHVAAFLHH